MSLIQPKNSPLRFLGRPASRCKKCLLVSGDSKTAKTGVLHYVNRMGGVQCLRCHPPKSDEDVLLRLTICEGVWIDANNGFDALDEQSIVQDAGSDSRAILDRLAGSGEAATFRDSASTIAAPAPPTSAALRMYETQDEYVARMGTYCDSGLYDNLFGGYAGVAGAGWRGGASGAVVDAAGADARHDSQADALQIGCPYIFVNVRSGGTGDGPGNTDNNTRRTDYVHFKKIPGWATEWSCQQRGGWLPIPEFWRATA